jgi:hypothetical protein
LIGIHKIRKKNEKMKKFVLLLLIAMLSVETYALTWPPSTIQLGSNTPSCGEYETSVAVPWRVNRYWVFQDVLPGQSICIMQPGAGFNWYIFKGDGSTFAGTENSYSGPYAGSMCIENNTLTLQTFTLLCIGGAGSFSPFEYSSFCATGGSMTLTGAEILIGNFSDGCPTASYSAVINPIRNNRIFNLSLSGSATWCNDVPAGFTCGVFEDGLLVGTYVGSVCFHNNESEPRELVIKFEGPTGAYSVNYNVECGGINIPLPLKLLSFNALAGKEGNKLYWKVSDVKNFSHFEIERSQDGKSFELLAKVEYSATSTYVFLDKVGGDSYYRLKMVDFNGDFSFSSIVHCGGHEEKITLFPNPSQNILNFSTTVEEVKIFNICGSLVYNLKENSSKNIDISCLQDGLYFVQLNGGTSLQKIIKK